MDPARTEPPQPDFGTLQTPAPLWPSGASSTGDGAATAPPPAGSPPALLRMAFGEEVPGYEIGEALGRGGMGVVYLARQTELGRTVALKMILGGGKAQPQDLARFLGEAALVASIRHPHVVTVYEYGEHNGKPFMALEHLPGGTLSGRLAGGYLPPAEAAGLVLKIARGVGAAHEQQIVHRDLKPGNVLFGDHRDLSPIIRQVAA